MSRLDSIALLVFFAWFLYYTFKISKNKQDDDSSDIKELSTIKSSIFIVLWLVWLVLWWNFIVESAVNIAKSFWVPNSFIGVTIIAIWTSLPELAASIMAAIKRNTDMAIGWVVWSNVFNTLWIIWWTWVVLPLSWYSWLNIDLAVNFAAALILLLFAFTYWKNFIDRKEWVLMFVWYILYISYLVYSIGIF